MQFILGRGLDEVIQELRKGHEPTPEGGEGDRSRGNPCAGGVSAAELASAFVTGRFLPSHPAAEERLPIDLEGTPRTSACLAQRSSRSEFEISAMVSTSPPISGSPGATEGPSRTPDILPGAPPGLTGRGFAQATVQVAGRWSTPIPGYPPPRHQALKPPAGPPGNRLGHRLGLAKAMADVDLTHTGRPRGYPPLHGPRTIATEQADASGATSSHWA